MALDLALDPLDTGSTAHYWRITSAHLDHLHNAVTVWMHGWRDERSRREGRAPAASITVNLQSADLATSDLHAADTAALYVALKMRAADPARFEHVLGSNHPAILSGAADC